MEPIEYLRIVRRRWKVLLACVIVGMAGGWLTTPSRPATGAQLFEATHTLIRQTSDRPTRQSMGTVALFATTGEVPERVAARLGQPGDGPELASRVTAVADEALGTVTISSRSSDGTRAARLANAFAEETLAYLAEQAQLDQQRQADVLTQRLDELEDRIAELDGQIARSSGSQAALLTAQRDAQIRQFGVAYEQFQQLASEGPPAPDVQSLAPATPVPVDDAGFSAPSSRPARMVMAGLVAMVLGGILVLALERVDTKIRTKEGAERVLRRPVIAEVPKLTASQRAGHNVVTVSHPLSPATESFRILRASVLLMPTEGGRPSGPPDEGKADDPQVVLVTSPGPGEGKTTTVANLAVAFAETGRTVLVLSSDFRRPEIHKYFGVSEGRGLSDVLKGGPDAPTLLEVLRFTTVGGVAMVTSGTPTDTPAELPGIRRRLIEDARALADIVLIDTAPVLVTNDAVELSPEADAVVLVARSGKTSTEAAARASELLTRVGANVTGVALIGVPKGTAHAYSYYYNREDEEPASAPARMARRLRQWAFSDGRDRDDRPAPAPKAAAEPAPKTPDAVNGQRAARPRRGDRLAWLDVHTPGGPAVDPRRLAPERAVWPEEQRPPSDEG